MKSLKLNNLENSSLNEKEMNHITGGENWICSCSCYYANNGGSSDLDNGFANSEIPGGGHSTNGDNHLQVPNFAP